MRHSGAANGELTRSTGAFGLAGVWHQAEADLKAWLKIDPKNPKALKGLETVAAARKDPAFDPRKWEL